MGGFEGADDGNIASNDDDIAKLFELDKESDTEIEDNLIAIFEIKEHLNLARDADKKG